MEIVLSGMMQLGQFADRWDSLKLVQKDGYKIDLVARLSEMSNSFPNKKFQLSYYISDKPLTENQIKEKLIMKLAGALDVSFSSYETGYSSYTRWTEYETGLKIGGHDLYKEFSFHVNGQTKYVLIKVKLN